MVLVGTTVDRSGASCGIMVKTQTDRRQQEDWEIQQETRQATHQNLAISATILVVPLRLDQFLANNVEHFGNYGQTLFDGTVFLGATAQTTQMDFDICRCSYDQTS